MTQLSSIFRNIIDFLLNLIGGIIVHISPRFKQGDFIEINRLIGSVQRKAILKTSLQTLKGETLKINNKLFILHKVSNYSQKKMANIDIQVSVVYSDNIKTVKRLIKQFMVSSKLILRYPPTEVHVKKIKNGYVVINIKPWCSIDNYIKAANETPQMVLNFLENKGIAIEHNSNSPEKLMIA